jgi:hypothetical protein
MDFDDVVLIAERCFGEHGCKTVNLWKQYNEAYFGGVLKPTPVLYVPTSPYGHWVGCTIPDANIYLMPVADRRPWSYVRGVLLHEMVHQHLEQIEKDWHHAGQPWCAEIMRISRMFGFNVWAGKYTVVKVDGQSKRANKRAPADLTPDYSLNQCDISHWPAGGFPGKSNWPGFEPPELLATTRRGTR